MRRRRFIALMAKAAVAAPVVARAQQPMLPVVGFLRNTSPGASAHLLAAFRSGLEATGYVEGRNVAIEYRWTGGQTDRLPAMAADLVARQVNVIVTLGSTPAAFAAKGATTAIPIVFMVGADPVEIGLVASLTRPGGNLTGVFNLNRHVAPKWVEVLHELVPATAAVALMVNPRNPRTVDFYTAEVETAARTLGRRLHIVHASSERDFDTAFASLRQLRAGGLVIAPDLLFITDMEKLAALTLRDAVPAIYPFREFAVAGGLASYGTNLADTYRLAGVYTGRVLKGEKPADLPVQQATRVELIINLKTAKALGVTIPQALLLRADEVIQ